MSELGSLFLIVALVYLVQCIWWINPASVAFTVNRKGRGKGKSQGFVWSSPQVLGLLANPLPPLSPPLAVFWPSFQLGPDGLRFSSKNGEKIFVPWEKLELKDDSTSELRHQEQPFFKGGEAQVRRYAKLLREIQKVKKGQRASVIHNWLRKASSTDTAGRRILVFCRRVGWLKFVCNLQFFFLFVATPLAFSRLGLAILWRLIAIVLVVSITVVLEFWTLHKAFYPEAKDSRWQAALTILLSPIAAIRACDVVARELLGGFHPVAAAGALLSSDEFREFAGRQLRQVRFTEHADPWYQKALAEALENSVRQKGLKPEELMQAPAAQSGCVFYCPRCLAQFNKQRETCSDCGYEALKSLEEPSAEAQPVEPSETKLAAKPQ